jgi:hypothetical protein
LTIIVGVKCTDGVVIGSDGIATSTAGQQPIMQIPSNDKIKIFNNQVIAAATGSIGYTQRMHFHLDKAVNGGGFLTTKRNERPQLLCKRFIADLQSSMAQFSPQYGFGFGALLATAIDDDPCLIEFSTHDFQPEFKEKKLFYCAIGSGQPLADPFLAFISRVLWKDTLPDTRLGRFGLYWALQHTINLAPGTVGEPIKLSVLRKGDSGWNAHIVDDTQEAAQFVASVESKIGGAIAEPDSFSEDIQVPPEPPKPA